MEFLKELLTEENIELLCWALGALLAFEQIIAKAKTESNSTLELIVNVLKSIKGKNLAPMILLAVLVAPMLTGCSTLQNKPEQPGEVLAALESDYTTALIAAKQAYDAGALTPSKVEKIDKLRHEIGPMLDMADEAFEQGQNVEGNEWVKLIAPLVTKLLLEVPQ